MVATTGGGAGAATGAGAALGDAGAGPGAGPGAVPEVEFATTRNDAALAGVKAITKLTAAMKAGSRPCERRLVGRTR